MYGMSGLCRCAVCPSEETDDSAFDGTADGGRAIGRAAKGLLIDWLESVRWCSKGGAGITGMLLLVGRLGRSGCVGTFTFACVSDLLRPLKRDGGAGREPVGREGVGVRRLARYEACCSFDMYVGPGVGRSLEVNIVWLLGYRVECKAACEISTCEKRL